MYPTFAGVPHFGVGSKGNKKKPALTSEMGSFWMLHVTVLGASEFVGTSQIGKSRTLRAATWAVLSFCKLLQNSARVTSRMCVCKETQEALRHRVGPTSWLKKNEAHLA